MNNFNWPCCITDYRRLGCKWILKEFRARDLLVTPIS